MNYLFQLPHAEKSSDVERSKQQEEKN